MILALLSACTEAPAPAATVVTHTTPETAPDMVLVGVAGLRSDSLSRSSDWFFEAFAGERGVVYANAYAQSPSTFVSLGSLLTGRYPSAVPLCGFPSDPGDTAAQAPWCTEVPATVPTLPGVLALYGYRTALVTADVHGAERLAPLFQDAIVASRRWEDRATDWERVRTLSEAWWNEDATRPRLLVVAVSDLDARHAPALRARMGLDLAGQGGAPTRIDRPTVIDAYQQASRSAGRAVKGLLDSLRAGSPRATWAAVFGTNGINLGDAAVPAQALRDRSWNDLLLDRTLHVPLALIGPADVPPARVEAQVVELVDLLPTLLARGGAVVPAGIPGQDLLAASFATDPAATAYGEFGDMLSVRSGTRLWSVRAFFHNRSALDPELTNFVLDYRPDAGKYALHDLSGDPFQERNLLESDPEGARRMNDLLVQLRTGPGAPPEGALDARRIWELRMSAADGYW
ncbi:MAG: sulfatase-like hydrolase/transferase [Pseudomonadota bacterium]|nr:sulfatase-like hydrolase/transferase [Pseudomonadota bacterium]